MNIVKATSFIAAALMAAGTGAAAQESAAPSPITYLRPVTFPVLAPGPAPLIDEDQAAAPRPAASPDRRDDIRTLETVLTMAVKSGADKLALQMRATEPGSLFIIDTGRTRGFDLQGYGVFFDVDVPMMKQSVLYVARQLNQQDMRAQLQNNIANLPDSPLRDFAIRELRRMDQQGMRQSGVASPTQIAQPGVVTGQVADATAAPEADPNELYTQAVKTSLIDAMLKYSVGLKSSSLRPSNPPAALTSSATLCATFAIVGPYCPPPPVSGSNAPRRTGSRVCACTAPGTATYATVAPAAKRKSRRSVILCSPYPLSAQKHFPHVRVRGDRLRRRVGAYLATHQNDAPCGDRKGRQRILLDHDNGNPRCMQAAHDAEHIGRCLR